MRFYEEADYGSNKNGDFQKGVAISRVGNKSPIADTSSFAGGAQAQAFFWLRRGEDVERATVGNSFRKHRSKIPTYVRNGNSTVVYQVDSANTVTNEQND